MLRTTKTWLAGLAAATALAVGSSARAEPLDPKILPADAKWVVHLDVDGLLKTDTWKLVEPKLKNNPKYVQGLARLEKIFNAKLPGDVHDVTLYGPSFGEKEAVIILRANANEDRITTLLALNETYTSEAVDGKTIHGWQDKGKQLYGAFGANKTMVVAQNKDRIANALKLIDGKGEALKNEAIVPTKDNAKALVYVAADDVANLNKTGAAKSDALAHLSSAWFTLVESNKSLTMHSKLVAEDEAAAQNIVKQVEGGKAALSFAANDDPDAAMLADAAADFTAKSDARQVDINWGLPIQTVTDLLNRFTGDVGK